MSRLPGVRPAASLVVSIIALAVAASGVAVAASALVSGDKLIKKNSLSGNRLRTHTLTGTQINLDRLGKVPSARTADTAHAAGTATSAGHAGSADNAANATNALNATSAGNGARRIDFVAQPTDPTPSGGPGAHTLLTLGELTMTASCSDAGSGQARVYVAFNDHGAPASANLIWEGHQFNNPGTSPVLSGGFFVSGSTFVPADVSGGNRFGSLRVTYRNDARTITIDFDYSAQTFPPLTGCEVTGTAVPAPS